MRTASTLNRATRRAGARRKSTTQRPAATSRPATIFDSHATRRKRVMRNARRAIPVMVAKTNAGIRATSRAADLGMADWLQPAMPLDDISAVGHVAGAVPPDWPEKDHGEAPLPSSQLVSTLTAAPHGPTARA